MDAHFGWLDTLRKVRVLGLLRLSRAPTTVGLPFLHSLGLAGQRCCASLSGDVDRMELCIVDAGPKSTAMNKRTGHSTLKILG